MGTREQFPHLMTWSYLYREADTFSKLPHPLFVPYHPILLFLLCFFWQDDKLFLDLEWRCAAGYRLQRRADSLFPSHGASPLTETCDGPVFEPLADTYTHWPEVTACRPRPVTCCITQ